MPFILKFGFLKIDFNMWRILMDWPAVVALGGKTCDSFFFLFFFPLLIQHVASCDGLLLTRSCCVSIFIFLAF